MSIRSAQNSNLIVNDLKVNGKLTLANPESADEDLEINSLVVATSTETESLTVTGMTETNTLQVDSTSKFVGAVTMDDPLTLNNALTVTGGTKIENALSVNSITVSGQTNLENGCAVSGELSVSSTSYLEGDVTCGANATIDGNLTVNGTINGSSSSGTQMEINYVQVLGNASSVSGNITLQSNTTNTEDYSVFGSIYYGYTGSSGTYDADATSSNVGQIVISNRSASEYTWTISKGTGDNVNMYIVLLVVYNLGSTYPSSYT